MGTEGLDKYVWHIAEREKGSEIEAAYIHGIIEWVAQKTGKKYRKILDVPCGNGRLHPFLRKYGYEVYGFDLSEELVNEARAKGLNCWIGDMMDEKAYKGVYDVILNWFSSFGYFSDSENKELLKIWNRHLTEKGLLLIDTALEGHTLQWVHKYDNGILEITEYKKKGKKTEAIFRFYKDERDVLKLLREFRKELIFYSVDEIVKMLEDAEFSVLEVFDRYSFKKWNNGYGATFVALKK